MMDNLDLLRDSETMEPLYALLPSGLHPTLIEMAEQMPVSPSEMLSVTGVGMRKLERFGKEFMALIRAHVDGDDEE